MDMGYFTTFCHPECVCWGRGDHGLPWIHLHGHDMMSTRSRLAREHAPPPSPGLAARP